MQIALEIISVLHVFVFDVQTLNEKPEKWIHKMKKLNGQVINCNLKDKLFSYIRQLLDIDISSE